LEYNESKVKREIVVRTGALQTNKEGIQDFLTAKPTKGKCAEYAKQDAGCFPQMMLITAE